MLVKCIENKIDGVNVHQDLKEYLNYSFNLIDDTLPLTLGATFKKRVSLVLYL